MFLDAYVVRERIVNRDLNLIFSTDVLIQFALRC